MSEAIKIWAGEMYMVDGFAIWTEHVLDKNRGGCDFRLPLELRLLFDSPWQNSN